MSKKTVNTALNLGVLYLTTCVLPGASTAVLSQDRTNLDCSLFKNRTVYVDQSRHSAYQCQDINII